MKKRLLAYCLGTTVLISCDPSGVKEVENEKIPVDDKTEIDTIPVFVSDVGGEHDVVDEKKLKDGITIKWFEHGDGDQLTKGDVAHVDYKVYLKNEEVIDGNHLVNKPFVPFMVGFGMQTKGWDIALQELRVGDFAEVFIPAKMARGEQSVEGLFPANSDNILRIKVVQKNAQDRERDGNKVWVFEENDKVTKKFGEGNFIEFHCMAFSPSTPMFVNTYRNNTPFKLNLEDHGLIPGLKKALINAKKGDRMLVYIPSSEAYKAKGDQDIVKPNEDLMYNVLVMDVVDE